MPKKKKTSRSITRTAGPRSSRKELRHKLIEGLLSEGGAKTQAELVAALAKRGMAVTQATVSRDLREIGARKVRNSSGEGAYVLGPEEVRDSYLQPGRDALMRKALAGSVSAVVASGDIVLLKTLPGHAPYVASLVDGAFISRVLGTVAGDDTIIVVCEEGFGSLVKEVLADLTGAHGR
ncbi:MAG: arginine repressor [Acidimicrobiia bacterium]